MDDIRERIVEARRRRLAALGPWEGTAPSPAREAPLVSFAAALREGGVIGEVKRRSPSAGDIAPGLDAVAQTGRYAAAGVRAVSVLTEPEGFNGRLDDLRAVKRAHPGLAVLRKDFLLEEADVDVAFRVGADAVLLIAAILSAEQLARLHRRAEALGLAALVELRDAADVAKARPLRPPLVGVNSRDLASFRIDPMIPPRVRAMVDWPAAVVYESGIGTPEHAAWAGSCGFAGLLVGTAAVRAPDLAGHLRRAFRAARPSTFWPRVAAALNRRDAEGGGPLVKICGLARPDDARRAAALGADLLGFVFWPGSARRARADVLRELADLDVPKVAVVVEDAHDPFLPAAVERALADGTLDAVQFHGAASPVDCARLAPAHFQAVRPGHPALAEGEERRRAHFAAPRALLDAASARPGGSGERVPDAALDAWRGPLWLAGGLTPDNVAGAVRRWKPELVDVAGGVESSPGLKDERRLASFIRAAREAGRTGDNR